MQNEENKKSIQKKLGTVKYNCAQESHIKVNQAKCKKCKNKPCTFICPASVFNYEEETKEIVVQYENCLECGSCRIICPHGVVEWQPPKSGCGVVYKNS